MTGTTWVGEAFGSRDSPVQRKSDGGPLPVRHGKADVGRVQVLSFLNRRDQFIPLRQ